MIKEIQEPREDEYREVAWGKPTQTDKISPIWINRGKVRDSDVKFEVLYCGICHYDADIGLNNHHHTTYPCVPGHELLGRVTELGINVTKFKIGDLVGVGCMVGACLDCKQCNNGDEQYCDNGMM